MRDFRDETERAVWAAAFAMGPNDPPSWEAGYAEQWADYVVDKLRERTKPPRVLEEKLLEDAAKAVRKLASRMPEPPSDPKECGDQSKMYYENLAKALEEWRKKL